MTQLIEKEGKRGRIGRKLPRGLVRFKGKKSSPHKKKARSKNSGVDVGGKVTGIWSKCGNTYSQGGGRLGWSKRNRD